MVVRLQDVVCVRTVRSDEVRAAFGWLFTGRMKNVATGELVESAQCATTVVDGWF